MIQFPERALFIQLPDQLDGAVIAIAYADIENAFFFISQSLHFARERIIHGNGFFAEHVLSRCKSRHRDLIMRVVGRKHINRSYFRISESDAIIRFGKIAMILFFGLLSARSD